MGLRHVVIVGPRLLQVWAGLEKQRVRWLKRVWTGMPQPRSARRMTVCDPGVAAKGVWSGASHVPRSHAEKGCRRRMCVALPLHDLLVVTLAMVSGPHDQSAAAAKEVSRSPLRLTLPDAVPGP